MSYDETGALMDAAQQRLRAEQEAVSRWMDELHKRFVSKILRDTICHRMPRRLRKRFCQPRQIRMVRMMDMIP